MTKAPVSSGSLAITGMGAVSAFGRGYAALWRALDEGRTGIRIISRFPTDEFSTHLGATVPDWDDPRFADDHAGACELCRAFAHDAAREAWGDAGLSEARYPGSRLALVLGTGLGREDRQLHTIAEELAGELGIRGPLLTISTACSSSTNALGWARHLLLDGTVDAVLAGGVDVLSPEVFAGFHALGVLSEAACAPFSLPLGTTLGEGAGFMVLEKVGEARRRDLPIHAYLSGYGFSGDAYHETSPEPGGTGVARALTGALDSCGLPSEAIDYVNAHGSGTPANDPAEWRGIQKALGKRAVSIPVSSSKGSLGHAQGAAGVLEGIATVEAMKRNQIPPSSNFTTLRPFGPPDPVGRARPRAHDTTHVASLNSAFGGANAAVIFSRNELEPREREVRPVYLLGAGTLGSFGTGNTAAAEAVTGGRLRTGRVREFDLREYLPRADPRGMDPMTCYLAAAATLALRDAGLAIKGDLREAAGLIVGTLAPSPTSVDEFRDSIGERGLARLSATAFARIVLNAPAGICSKLLALRGPNVTLSSGRSSGLAAIVAAVMVLASDDETEVMIAGGVDELRENECSLRSEGAGCVALARKHAMDPDHAPVKISGWLFSGPDSSGESTAEFLAESGMTPDDLDVLFSDEVSDDLRGLMAGAESRRRIVDYGPCSDLAPAAGSVWAVTTAVQSIRRGDIRRAAVISSAGQSCTTSLLLTAPEMNHGQ